MAASSSSIPSSVFTKTTTSSSASAGARRKLSSAKAFDAPLNASSDLHEVSKFHVIHDRENRLRQSIGLGTNDVSQPYEGLKAIDESQFSDMRVAMKQRVHENRTHKSSSGRAKTKSHFISSSTPPRPHIYPTHRFAFANIIDALPEDLKTQVVLAGGAILSAITGDIPADYDLFLVKGKIPTEQVIENLLTHWQSHIVFISRSANAITFTLRPSVHMTDEEREIREKHERGESNTLSEITQLAMDINLTPSQSLEAIQDIMACRRYNMTDTESRLTRIKWLPINLGSDHQRNYKVQIILREYRTPSEVVHGFDLPAGALLYHMGAYYGTRSALHTLRTMTHYIALDRASTTYNQRLVKYLKRGFRIYTPVALTRDHKSEARKLILDQKRTPRMDTFLPIYERGSDTGFERTLVGLYALSKMHVGVGGHKLQITCDYAVVMDENDVKKDIYQHWLDGKIDAYGFSVGSGSVKAILDLTCVKDLNLEKLAISPKIQLLKTDPGRQWNGSFNPLDLNLKEWGRKRLGTLNYGRIQMLKQVQNAERLARQSRR